MDIDKHFENALDNNDKNSMKMCLENGANINFIGKYIPETPLIQVIKKNRIHPALKYKPKYIEDNLISIQFLIDNGADINVNMKKTLGEYYYGPSTALNFALTIVNYDTIKILFDNNVIVTNEIYDVLLPNYFTTYPNIFKLFLEYGYEKICDEIYKDLNSDEKNKYDTLKELYRLEKQELYFCCFNKCIDKFNDIVDKEHVIEEIIKDYL